MKRNRDRVHEVSILCETGIILLVGGLNRYSSLQIIRLGNQITEFFEEEDQMNQALQKHGFITAVRSMDHTARLSGTEVSDVVCTRVQVNICIELRAGLSKDELSGLLILNDITLREQFDTVMESRSIPLQSVRQR